MKIRGIGLLVCFFMAASLYAESVSVFVSFSMPENLLEETLKDSARLQVPAYLNGLYENSMQATAIKVMQLSQHVPGLNLLIDPTRFERFGIKQVPALVVEGNSSFDVIYGNLPIKEGLLRMAERGDSGLSIQDVRRQTGE